MGGGAVAVAASGSALIFHPLVGVIVGRATIQVEQAAARRHNVFTFPTLLFTQVLGIQNLFVKNRPK